ncbi:MAG: hypothetical protein ACRDZM_05100 [Acidimicrobiia bacterium]
MNRHAVTVVTLAFALVVTACGDGGGEGDVLGLGDRNLDRCSLLTAAEAEQWLGAPVSEPAPAEGIDGEPDPVTCSYVNEEAVTSILIQVYDGDVFFAEEGSASRTGETIEGLGEDAWMGDGSVSFLQNQWSASVARIAGQIPDEDLLEIAELMSSRLP